MSWFRVTRSGSVCAWIIHRESCRVGEDWLEHIQTAAVREGHPRHPQKQTPGSERAHKAITPLTVLKSSPRSAQDTAQHSLTHYTTGHWRTDGLRLCSLRCGGNSSVESWKWQRRQDLLLPPPHPHHTPLLHTGGARLSVRLCCVVNVPVDSHRFRVAPTSVGNQRPL